jgi:hypothetical protein
MSAGASLGRSDGWWFRRTCTKQEQRIANPRIPDGAGSATREYRVLSSTQVGIDLIDHTSPAAQRPKID